MQGLGVVRSVRPGTLTVDVPDAIRERIEVEGTSLTPYDLDGGSFRCAIIPNTCDSTVLKDRRREHVVNIEYDIQAENVERMIRFVHSD